MSKTNRASHSRQTFLTALLLLGLSSLLLISPVAQADSVVNSPFVFQLDDSFFNTSEFNVISKLAGQQTFSLGNTVIQDIAPVNVTNITGQVNYAMAAGTPQIYLGAEITLASSTFNVTMNIAQISIDATVQTVSGSTVIDTLVQGNCTNIPLTLAQGQGKLVGTLLVALDAQGLPTVTVPWIEADWGPTAWTIGDFSCTGVAGFKDRVKAGLVNYLVSTSSFNSQLRTLVSQQAATYQTQVRQLFVQKRSYATGINGLTVSLTPAAVVNLNGTNFQVNGTLGFDFASSSINNSSTVATPASSPASLSLYSLVVPPSLINALNTAAYATGFYHYATAGQALSGFKSLLSNGLVDFFVWPELAYYSSSADFNFDFKAGSAPSLGAMVDNGNGTVSQALAGNIVAETFAPVTNSGQTNLVQELMTTFSGPASGAYTLSLSKTGSVTTLNAAFSQVAFQLAATWDPTYVATVMHNNYINVDMLESNVASSIQSNGYSVTVSPLSLTSSLSLSPTSMQKQGSWLEINWHP